jgi:hypothetical protein
VIVGDLDGGERRSAEAGQREKQRTGQHRDC